MLYIGFLHHIRKDEKGKDWEVNSCLVVEATGPEEACKRLRRKILRNTKDDLFGQTKEIYLEGLVEVAEDPKTPLIAQWKETEIHEGDPVGSIYTFLPAKRQKTAHVYGWGDPNKDEVPPFIERKSK